MAMTLKVGELCFLHNPNPWFIGNVEMGYPPESLSDDGRLRAADGRSIAESESLLYLGEHLDPPLSQWNSKVLVGETVFIVRGAYLKRLSEND